MALSILAADLATADEAAVTASRVLSDVTALDGSADGALIVALHRGEVALFNATTLAPITTFYPPSGQPTAVAFSPSGAGLAIGLNNSSVLLYNTTTLLIETWAQVPSSPDNWVTAMSWSPDGSKLAFRSSDGKLRILNAALALLVEFADQSEGPIAWADINGTFEAITEANSGAGGISLWHISGTFERLAGDFYTPYGDATWAMWPDGRFIAIAAPLELPSSMLFASSDFGRNATLVSHAAEFGDDGLSANRWTGEFASFGGAARITFWRANATPYAELPTPDPCRDPRPGERSDCMGALVWIGPDSAVAWNQIRSQLFRVEIARAAPDSWVTIDAPEGGSTQNGDFVAGGRCDDVEGGVVWVRADGLPWHRLPCRGVWYTTLNATYWRPGNHTILAALFNGTVFSQWATLQVSRQTDANSTASQPTVIWNNPRSRFGASFSPGQDLAVGGYSPNTADGRLAGAWIRVDGSPWQPTVLDGNWRLPFDETTLSKGYHTFEALGWDGVAFSEIAVVRVFYNVEPSQIQLWANIGTPSPKTVLAVASRFQGEWGARNLANGSQPSGPGGLWVEVSVAGGPWLKLNSTNVSTGQWNFTLPSPFAVTSSLSFCVRTVNSTRLGESFCADYFAPSIADDRAPSVAIVSSEGRRTTSGFHAINVTGSALDDFGVIAVFVRIDGGTWQAVDGTGQWSFSIMASPNAAGIHTVEAVAYDGFRYSSMVGREILVDMTSPPVDDNPANPGPNGGGPSGSFPSFLTDASAVWILIVAVAMGAGAIYWVTIRRRAGRGPSD